MAPTRGYLKFESEKKSVAFSFSSLEQEKKEFQTFLKTEKIVFAGIEADRSRHFSMQTHSKEYLQTRYRSVETTNAD